MFDVLGRLGRERPQHDRRLAFVPRLLDGLDEVRLHELAAVGDHRVGPRHLEQA